MAVDEGGQAELAGQEDAPAGPAVEQDHGAVAAIVGLAAELLPGAVGAAIVEAVLAQHVPVVGQGLDRLDADMARGIGGRWQGYAASVTSSWLLEMTIVEDLAPGSPADLKPPAGWCGRPRGQDRCRGQPVESAMTIELLVNIDVDDLERAAAFYTAAFALTPGRRFGDRRARAAGRLVTALSAGQTGGSPAVRSTNQPRDYGRHWTPVHLDFVVPDLDVALERAVAAGAHSGSRHRHPCLGPHRPARRPVRPRLLPDPVQRAGLRCGRHAARAGEQRADRDAALAAADRIDAAEQPMRLAVGTGGEEQRAGGLRREAVAEAQPP